MPNRDKYLRDQTSVTTKVIDVARRLWRQLTLTGDWDAEWLKIVSSLEIMAISGQIATSQLAAEYVRQSAIEAGVDMDAVGRISPRGLAGVSADGSPWAPLLYEPVKASRFSAMAQSLGTAEALAVGSSLMDHIIQSQLSDAKRTSEVAAMHTYPHARYAIRVVYPPCCGRCAVLAGMKLTLAHADFLRHPQCDCGYELSGEGGYTSARELFDKNQIRGLSKADAQAIKDGADPSQVINARSGMKTLLNEQKRLIKYTTSGVTRRGLAYRLMQQRHGAAIAYKAELDEVNRNIARARRTGNMDNLTVRVKRSMPYRLRPETIYDIADNRDEVMRLLRVYGYVI